MVILFQEAPSQKADLHCTPGVQLQVGLEPRAGHIPPSGQAPSIPHTPDRAVKTEDGEPCG